MDNLKRSIYALKAKGTFEKSKLKATYEGDMEPPKEKHVQTILWTLQGSNIQTSPEQAFSSLSQRLMGSHWCIVLKAEIILHRGIEQVGPGYSSRLADLNIPMQNFNDPSEKGSAHNKIIQDYFVYIRAKAHNHSRRNSSLLVPPTERSRYFERLEVPDLLRETGYLLTQLGHLVKLGPSFEQAIRNYHAKLSQNAAALVLKDGNPLYRTLTLAMERVLDCFFEMEKPLAELALEQYKKFETCSRMLAKFFEMATYLPSQGVTAPTFVQKPREVLASMSSYLNEGGSESAEPHDATSFASELRMSKEEIEAQCRALEEFEREKERRKAEEAKHLELISEPVVEARPDKPQTLPQTSPQPFQSSPQPPTQPSQADLIMSSFSQPPIVGAGSQPQADMMGGGMMNPMMMGGMNPYMMAQYMTMSMMGANPYMTGMMNPMMTAPVAPTIKANIDPNSKPVGHIGSEPPRGTSYQPYGTTDPFSQSSQRPGRASNPFDSAPVNPYDSAPSNPFDAFSSAQPTRPVYDAFGNSASTTGRKPASKDPFADLL
jgi:hypothetical protein